MKKFVSILCVMAILTVALAMPGYASDNYQIIGSAVVDDDTENNEVIFGDDFNRTSEVNADGHPKDFLWANTASSHHGLVWARGVKPASTAKYLGTWSYTLKDDSLTDSYFRMETGSETTSKTAAHIISVAPGEDVFAGSGSETPGVYVIECDILPGSSDTVTITFPANYMYSETFSPIRIAGTNCTSSQGYDVRFDPEQWHHVVAVIDEVNGKYYGFIDGELFRESTFAAEASRTKGTQIRIVANLIENTYCGIDNFVVRKAGDRVLVFDGVLYNDSKTNAAYTNKSDTIASDAANVFLNKLIINESSAEKKYMIAGAVYGDSQLQNAIPYSISIAPYGYYHYNKTFSADEFTNKAKIFMWKDDSITPVMKNEVFLESQN